MKNHGPFCRCISTIALASEGESSLRESRITQLHLRRFYMQQGDFLYRLLLAMPRILAAFSLLPPAISNALIIVSRSASSLLPYNVSA